MPYMFFSVVWNAAGLQPVEAGGHPGEADAEADQVLPPTQGHPQEHGGSQPAQGPPGDGENYGWEDILCFVHLVFICLITGWTKIRYRIHWDNDDRMFPSLFILLLNEKWEKCIRRSHIAMVNIP